MTCPKCHAPMRQYERAGVTIDQCENCRGIFLDRGELERLIDAEDAWNRQRGMSPPPPPAPGYPSHGAPTQVYPSHQTPGYQPGYPSHQPGYPTHGGHGGYSAYGHHGHRRHKGHRRRKTFFDELFD